jgi:hypothetical protein
MESPRQRPHPDDPQEAPNGVVTHSSLIPCDPLAPVAPAGDAQDTPGSRSTTVLRSRLDARLFPPLPVLRSEGVGNPGRRINC